MRKEAACLAVLGCLILGVAPAHAAPTTLADWPFYEGSGPVAHDVSGNGLDGTFGAILGTGSLGPTWTVGHDGGEGAATRAPDRCAVARAQRPRRLDPERGDEHEVADHGGGAGDLAAQVARPPHAAAAGVFKSPEVKAAASEAVRAIQARASGSGGGLSLASEDDRGALSVAGDGGALSLQSKP